MNEVTDSSDNSLLSSAFEQLKSINDYDIQLSSLKASTNPDGDKCVKVMSISNLHNNPNTSAYITLNQYLKNQNVLIRVDDNGSGTSGFTTLTDNPAKYSVDNLLLQ
jgi:hypothetical protein